MIFFDVTKTAKARHASGLLRVTRRLAEELGTAAQPVQWDQWDRRLARDDWFFTAELFSPAERPGFEAFLEQYAAQCAALFHDAIPLQHPHVTWSKSVERHPSYLKMLASFGRVAAVSQTSAQTLARFWQWQVVRPRAHELPVILLGSDFDRAPRAALESTPPGPVLLCLGIIEPRKNQGLLLDVCEALWAAGCGFELHVAGRTNPEFGRPLESRIKSLRRRWRSLHYHRAPSDDALAELFRQARAVVFPTIAEGCGLPLLESLWRGRPCVASDLPVLRENAEGGCVLLPVNDADVWQEALRRILFDDTLWNHLAGEATSRPLPTWADTAAQLRRWLEGG